MPKEKPKLTPEQQRLRDFEADFTPLPVAIQALEKLRELEPKFTPQTLLDPSAGKGVWCEAVRQVFGELESLVVEPRAEEHTILAGMYSHLYRGTYEDAFYVSGRGEMFDLVATNPPFSRMTNWIPRLLHCLNRGGFLVLYAKANYGLRSKAAHEVMRSYPPKYQFPIYGTVRHRDYGGGDSQSYATWVWQKGYHGPTAIHQLERLPAADRRI